MKRVGMVSGKLGTGKLGTGKLGTKNSENWAPTENWAPNWAPAKIAENWAPKVENWAPENLSAEFSL